jgi:hypothetical protein
MLYFSLFRAIFELILTLNSIIRTKKKTPRFTQRRLLKKFNHIKRTEIIMEIVYFFVHRLFCRPYISKL